MMLIPYDTLVPWTSKDRAAPPCDNMSIYCVKFLKLARVS